MFEANQHGFDLKMPLAPDRSLLGQPQERVRRAKVTAAVVADRKVRAVHELLVADDADDRLMRDRLAVGAGVEVQVVQASKLGQSLKIMRRLKASGRMGEDQFHIRIRFAITPYPM